MRLITFEDSVRRSRVGALAPDGRIVDLHSACALYLRDVENESAFDRLAVALVPPNMRELFAGGDTKRGASLIVWAIAEGRKMAAGIDKYLQAGQSAKTVMK